MVPRVSQSPSHFDWSVTTRRMSVSVTTPTGFVASSTMYRRCRWFSTSFCRICMQILRLSAEVVQRGPPDRRPRKGEVFKLADSGCCLQQLLPVHAVSYIL